jgi:hypothetical protein
VLLFGIQILNELGFEQCYHVVVVSYRYLRKNI